MVHSQTYISPIWADWFSYCKEHNIDPIDMEILEETGIKIR